jgi:hypothetical protein
MPRAPRDSGIAHSVTTATWRRLDAPGHDACRLIEDTSGWRLEGTAVFLHRGAAACLSYVVTGGKDWRTRRGSVRGFIGATSIDVTVVRSARGAWTFNGVPAGGLDDCEHLDLSFTPATNLPQVRQLTLNASRSADVPVAWLDLPCKTLRRLPQRYTRRSRGSYWYEAPTQGYAAELTLSPSGFVRRYPRLWELEPRHRARR